MKAQSSREQREQSAAQGRVIQMLRRECALYSPIKGRDDGTPLLTAIMKGEPADEALTASEQGVVRGRQRHPFNMGMIQDLWHANVHHSACLGSKVASVVGLGFADEKTTDVLDPLGYDEGFEQVLLRASMDFVNQGTGYMEVRRESDKANAPIKACHYLRAPDTYAFLEPDEVSLHYEIEMRSGGGKKTMAMFGDAANYLAREKKNGGTGIILPRNGRPPSEVIAFRNPNTFSRWYGMPEWLAAIASIELTKAINQQQFDFFQNRGVPEFFLFVLGGKVGDKDWKNVERSLQSTVGAGNAGKSVALNLYDSEIKVQLERLGLQGVTDGGQYESQRTTLALDIVAAHRTPAVIAGIQLPGKMGATNEAVNAILSFQLLTVGPLQKTMTSVLDRTLGDPKKNGGLALKRGDFKFNTLKDLMDLSPGGAMDTISRMKTQLPTAQAQGRDISQGLKKAAKRMTDKQMGEIIGHVMLWMRDQAA